MLIKNLSHWVVILILTVMPNVFGTLAIYVPGIFLSVFHMIINLILQIP